MKHIKKFEKKDNYLWCYIRISESTPALEDIEIFNDKESAENFYITEVNYIAVTEKKSDTNLIFTMEDAMNFLETSDYSYHIEIMPVKNNGKFRLHKELEIGRDSSKYNL